MSLLKELRGVHASPDDPAAALAQLCTALLAENRLPRGVVVAARIRIPGDAELPLATLGELGWSRIPIFWERLPAASPLEVEAHVRVKRRRKVREVRIAPREEILP